MHPAATDDRLLPFDLDGGGVDCLSAIENTTEHDHHMTPSLFEQLCVKL
jgi:hypothetical protein